MSTWTTISDDVLEPGKPIRSVDALALRDNPVAIAAGAANAPRVQPSTAVAWANSTNTAAERNWVLARTAGASVGAVGTYAFLGRNAINSSFAPGSTTAGSNLRYVGIVVFNQIWSSSATIIEKPAISFNNTPSGTWRCMGHAAATSNTAAASVWLRIS